MSERGGTDIARRKRKQYKATVEEDRARLNEEIRAPQVRTINHEGEPLGIIPIEEAMRIAREAELDLVEVAPDADPPVCRIMDYGKFLFEKKKKSKGKKTKTSQLKEIKLRPKIGDHDFDFKNRHVERFLKDGDKVKATIMFRGREMDFTELGAKLLDRVAEVHKDYASVEKPSKLEGRNMTMILAPLKTQKT